MRVYARSVTIARVYGPDGWQTSLLSDWIGPYVVTAADNDPNTGFATITPLPPGAIGLLGALVIVDEEFDNDILDITVAIADAAGASSSYLSGTVLPLETPNGQIVVLPSQEVNAGIAQPLVAARLADDETFTRAVLSFNGSGDPYAGSARVWLQWLWASS